MEARASQAQASGDSVEVAEAASVEIPELVGVLKRGMRDNPVHVAALGDDPERREQRLERLFTALFAVARDQRPLVARHDGRVVGGTGDWAPGGCRMDARQKLAMLPAMAWLGPRSTVATIRWTRAWEKRNPDRPHSHLGPIAVERHLQGQGIGSRILRAYCERLDRLGEPAYLETDKPQNVRLYKRFGFQVVDEAEVIGVPNWFMWRERRQGAT